MGAVVYERLASMSKDSLDGEPSDIETTTANGDGMSPEDEIGSEHRRGQRKNKFRLDPRSVSNAVLGLSDGMTVPFALTAGLSELGDTRVVVLAGLAELVAGAISMGLGGYLGAVSEQEICRETIAQTHQYLRFSSPHLHSRVSRRMTFAFARYQIPSTIICDLTHHFVSPQYRQYLPNFLLKFEAGVEEPVDSHAMTCALTIAAGYFVGGLIPLLPYLLTSDRKNVPQALLASVVTMAVALFMLGYGKACLIAATAAISECDSEPSSIEDGYSKEGAAEECDDDRDSAVMNTTRSSNSGRGFGSIRKGIAGGMQMLVVGALSAACAVVLVKLFNSLL